MARRPSLSDAAAPAIVTSPMPSPRTAPSAATARGASRVGKVGISFWVDPDAHRQLRLLSVIEGRPIQGLMEDALDLLFRAHGKHRLAGNGTGESS
jgi:hypothetical protein